MLIGWIDSVAEMESWTEGPEAGEELELLLGVAFEKLSEWAPKPLPAGTPEEPIPARYIYAQRLLTQHLWARKRAGDGEGFGADGFMISTYPLVREAYEAIRPKRSPLRGLR